MKSIYRIEGGDLCKPVRQAWAWQNGRGVGFDVKILKEAAQAGVETVRITTWDGREMTAPLRLVLDHGRLYKGQSGRWERSLPEAYWSINGEPPKRAIKPAPAPSPQLSLFGGSA